MAIFKYQPSPFCVLDEVDAPLDEANIGRLTRLLTEMAIDTQFIVITHSKKTMEAAQAMYGVTMQEAGVSKLVSVKFHHARAMLRRPRLPACKSLSKYFVTVHVLSTLYNQTDGRKRQAAVPAVQGLDHLWGCCWACFCSPSPC